MMPMDSDTVADALNDSLRRLLKPKNSEALFLEENPDLLDYFDSHEFGELISDLEASLDVELPIDQVDYASIARLDRLIDFICQNT
ncbi:MAG: hypothetical protein AAGA21_06060 [Pseudomonadota bacterium]